VGASPATVSSRFTLITLSPISMGAVVLGVPRKAALRESDSTIAKVDCTRIHIEDVFLRVEKFKYERIKGFACLIS
jgi:hypothetical protein